MKNIKSIAEKILKKAIRPQKYVLTLQFDKNGLNQLEKILGGIEGFSDMTATKVQFEIPLVINPDITDPVEYETKLVQILKTKPLNNMRFMVVRSAGRPTRIKPLRAGGE
jgi:hypothetical protein